MDLESKNTLLGCLNFHLTNNTLSDITFIVGKEEEHVRAHKQFLSFRSPVFEVMFYGSMKNETEFQTIPDISPKAFRNLLKYIYTEELTEDYETVVHTLNAAKQYQVVGLEKKCMDVYLNAMNAQRVFDILEEASFFGLTDLENKCFDYIDRNTRACLTTETFLSIKLELLTSIFKRDSLRIPEIDLYRALIRWADNQCRLRKERVNTENRTKVLKDAQRLIRYTLMTSREFAEGPALDGLITEEEKLQVLIYLNSSLDPTVPFETKTRTN